ncbi:MAG: YlzJ-like family protein [Syntrophomonadaceae bacterium]|nr:YlzJ-like family protein [Syntrophomonadaceae bacterium]
MIYYMLEPLELLAHLPQSERRYYRLSSGGILTAEVMSSGQQQVVDILSTDPMDYMNSEYSPGKVLKLQYE